MTSVLARRPLEPLSMTSTQRPTRRRSAREAFEDEELPEHGTRKKSRKDAEKITDPAAAETSGAVKPKRKTKMIFYEDNDDGFQFSRTRSKRTKTQTASVTKPSHEESAKQSSLGTTTSANRRQRDISPPPQWTEESEGAHSRTRRSARLSGEKQHLDTQAEAAPPESRSKRSGHRKTLNAFKEAGDEVALVTVKKSKRPPGTQPQASNRETPPGQVTTPRDFAVSKVRSPKKIALPFADTPIIKRNKELRKAGQSGRRDSTGTRGRRASSLIDSGTSNAVPHSEVDVKDFYKHIEQSIPEPRRMKQLLVWCGSRALPEKPSGNIRDTSAILAARTIQQELLDDFAHRSELSDWFSREDTVPTAIVKQPNPRNERMGEMVKELEEEIKRLQEEERAWKAVAEDSTSLPPPPPSSADAEGKLPSTSYISPEILDDPYQISIFAALGGTSSAHSSVGTQDTQEPGMLPASSSPSTLESRINALTKTLEPVVDMFADGVHQLAQYRNVADQVAHRILGAAADRLEERDAEAREKAGTANVGVGDVLGALGSVMAERERMQR